MLKFLGNLVKRLTSRKFLLALSAGALLAANQQWTELVAVAVAYVTAEGAGDAVERYAHEKTKTAEMALEDTKTQLGILDPGDAMAVDRGNIQSGADIPVR